MMDGWELPRHSDKQLYLIDYYQLESSILKDNWEHSLSGSRRYQIPKLLLMKII